MHLAGMYSIYSNIFYESNYEKQYDIVAHLLNVVNKRGSECQC